VVRYFDIGSPDSKMADARATSVEITLQPEDSINGCLNRHKVGVCETVKCLHQPSDAPVIWGKIGGGSLRMGNNNDECCYDAPVLGTSASLTATCGEEQYSTFITVIEPAGLWCSNHVTSIISNTAPYTFGGIGMNLHLYVLPFSVSFQNIAVEEVPCEVGYPTGYFTNLLFAGRWSHSVAMGAGRWIDIKPGNEFGEDKSTYGEWPTPWAPGELRWPIPVGWNVKGTKSGPQVKNFPVEYQSIKTIGADGTITQSKHEHTISKTTNGVIRLDGELINGN